MRKSLFAALAAVCMMTVTGASAQQRNRPAGMNSDGGRPTTEEMARMRTERMAEMLSLDQAQSAAIYEQNLRMAEVQQEMAGMRRAYAAKMKEVLTDAQYAKWQKMQEGRRHRMRSRVSNEMGPNGQTCCQATEVNQAECAAGGCTSKKECRKRHDRRRRAQ